MNKQRNYFNDRDYSFRGLIEGISELPGKSVLDIGCGSGKALNMLANRRLDCTGIDVALPDPRKKKIAASIALASGYNLPFKDGCFDIVVIKEVLHHVGNPEIVLSEARRCLKDNGYIWILEPVEDDPILHLGRKLHPYWEGVKVENRFFTDQLKKFIRDAGFKFELQGGVKGEFPDYLIFSLKETLWLLFDFLRIPLRDTGFFQKRLANKVRIGYDGKVVCYWCLAKKGANTD